MINNLQERKNLNKNSINSVYDKYFYLMKNRKIARLINKIYPELELELRSVRDRHLALIDKTNEIIKLKI